VNFPKAIKALGRSRAQRAGQAAGSSRSAGRGDLRPSGLGHPPLPPRLYEYFLPYQNRWISDRSRLRIFEKSRQIGISLCAAFHLVHKISEDNNPYDAWVSSRDEMQARLFGADCVTFARLLDLSAHYRGHHLLDRLEKNTAFRVRFDNKRSIHCLSSNPDAQAGKRGQRVFDEFALNPANRLLYSIGQPGTLWGGGLDIISTHRGTANYFNEIINEVKHKGNPKKFSLHTVTIEDACRDGLLARLKSKWAVADPDDARLQWQDDDFLQSMRNECADEESWLQEFMCVPGDDNAAFLSFDLIAACEFGHEEITPCFIGRGRLPLPPHSPLNSCQTQLFVGVDIGRDHDLTVIWALEKAGEICETRAVITLETQPFDAQEAVLYDLLALPSLRRCCVDQTGIGRQFAERAAQRFGRYRVEGIQFTSATKEELAYPLRTAFESKTVRIPPDKWIRADLRSIRKEVTSSGNLRFTGERTRHGHADRFWALALALHAARGSADNNKVYAQLI